MSTPTLKQAETHAYARILGIGAYRPSVVVTNDDVCQWIDSSDEWIRQRTGIVTRRRAPEDVSVLDMAEGASRDALASAGIEANQLGGHHRPLRQRRPGRWLRKPQLSQPPPGL